MVFEMNSVHWSRRHAADVCRADAARHVRRAHALLMCQRQQCFSRMPPATLSMRAFIRDDD